MNGLGGINHDAGIPNIKQSERKLLQTVNTLNTSMDQPEINLKDLPNGMDQIHELPDNEPKITLNIKKTNTPETLKVDLNAFIDCQISDLKSHVCNQEIRENKQIRVIFQGRPLFDDDKVGDIGFKDGNFIHFFISNPPQPTKEDVNMTSVSAELFEPERRGFDKFRPLDIMEEEIILFRAKFHSKFILLADKGLINENELYKQEEDWIKTNADYLLD